jgi:hypothetical protein
MSSSEECRNINVDSVDFLELRKNAWIDCENSFII